MCYICNYLRKKTKLLLLIKWKIEPILNEKDNRYIMKHQDEFEFLLQFCKKHKINANFYPPGSDITSLDLHLRKILRYEQDYLLFEDFLFHKCKEHTIYKIVDQFHCVYYLMLFPGENETCPFVVGPYLQIQTNYIALTQYTNLYGFSPQILSELQQLFSQIPFLTSDTSLQVFFQTFGELIWGEPKDFKFRVIDYNIDKAIYPLTPHSHTTIEDEQHIEAQFLDMYLTQENALIQAVSQGQSNKADEILSTLHTFLFIKEEKDPLRSVKNYALSLNTLLRKTTELNTVNSYQIMQVFSQFTHKIEQTTSSEACMNLLREIVRKYCMLVKNHSAMQYSVLVQQVIKNINLDLTADLSLRLS